MFFARSQIKLLIGQMVTVLAFCTIAMSARADLVKPDPAIAPVEVVAIQLKALQFNDNPEPDLALLRHGHSHIRVIVRQLVHSQDLPRCSRGRPIT